MKHYNHGSSCPPEVSVPRIQKRTTRAYRHSCWQITHDCLINIYLLMAMNQTAQKIMGPSLASQNLIRARHLDVMEKFTCFCSQSGLGLNAGCMAVYPWASYFSSLDVLGATRVPLHTIWPQMSLFSVVFFFASLLEGPCQPRSPMVWSPSPSPDFQIPQIDWCSPGTESWALSESLLYLTWRRPQTYSFQVQLNWTHRGSSLPLAA